METTVDATRADRLCRAFCNVIDEVITPRALTQAFGDALSRAQFDGLQYIHLHPQACIKDLAHGLAVSHPAAVKLVERLTAKGLIARSAHETDKRMVRLVVTEEGGRYAAEAMAARSAAIMEVLSGADAGCSCNLLNCLQAFIELSLSDEKSVDGVCLHCGGAHSDDCPVCQAEYAITGQMRTDS